jgi:23S rRNA (adenine2030-N6)-methyltransferase
MLSYRHAFHAGNHADILKHYTFSVVLDYFNQKDKAYCVIDTHAGAGMYQLTDAFSQKNKEFETGISKLLLATSLPDSLSLFKTMVRSFNTPKNLNLYPGSPKVSQYFLRSSDQLRLFEIHPSDYKILQENFSLEKTKQTVISMQDGFKGLTACLPPSTKRGIIIIDPPYEDKHDYQRVVDAIQSSLKRFATGTYIIWYPLLQRNEPAQMISALQQMNLSNWLNVTLEVSKPSDDGLGMFGSGLYIINPPWTLPKILEESLPYLQELLGQDSKASAHLAFKIP